MKQCKNPTCSARATTKLYCSRRCQVTMRNTGQPGYGQLPDIWVGMDIERALYERALASDITVRDMVVNLLEAELGIEWT